MSLIVLEGLSGSGKTTLAPHLASEIGADFAPSIPPELAAARRSVDAQRNVEARHLFYLSALAITSATLKPRLDAGELILLESYLDRAEAFHRGMGSSIDIDLKFLQQADIVIILECDESARSKRLSQRPQQRLSYWHHRSEECIASIQQYYDAHPSPLRLNSSYDIDESVRSAVRLVRGTRL